MQHHELSLYSDSTPSYITHGVEHRANYAAPLRVDLRRDLAAVTPTSYTDPSHNVPLIDVIDSWTTHRSISSPGGAQTR